MNVTPLERLNNFLSVRMREDIATQVNKFFCGSIPYRIIELLTGATAIIFWPYRTEANTHKLRKKGDAAGPRRGNWHCGWRGARPHKVALAKASHIIY